ncbi:hypothetical protein KSF_026370 [Reticulibacter mediterranei]|uniref:TIR domain-containing protein n=2 Tax=Reticulibacter mediterranei TaxID=2778369 RepID=A0A8J3MYZ4_9CHLR|nr:hypothetical protein KSF_026370 [Reticulibacter mediterranei]
MDNAVFYDTVGKFGTNEFYGLNNVGQFGRSHKILSDKRFKEADVHHILWKALEDLPQREEDDWLVELIQEDLFGVILSTSIDNFVENACLRGGMKEGRDFDVLNLLRSSNQKLDLRKRKRLTIVKAFGDLESRCYAAAGKELDVAARPMVRAFLSSLLAQEMLMIGYDPVWDRAIEQAFPIRGEAVYYVNEQEPVEDIPLYNILLQRCSKYCVAETNSYKDFLKVLRRSFSQPLPLRMPTPPASSEIAVQEQERKTVFISYCHEDDHFLKELLPHLNVYQKQGLIDVWSDKKIDVGAKWREKIEEALEAASVAILLISKYFLASKFINEVELPRLLEAAKKRGLEIIPIVLSPCVFGDSPLHHFQTINSPDHPVSKSRGANREMIWVNVAKSVKKASQRGAGTSCRNRDWIVS